MAAATIQDHLSVAFRLAKREPDAIKEIANTQAAFWYSFQAALISFYLCLEAQSKFNYNFQADFKQVEAQSMFQMNTVFFPLCVCSGLYS